MSGHASTKSNGLYFSIGIPSYQFYCTTPVLQSSDLGDGVCLRYGSAVSLKLPKVTDTTVLPVPTGSSCEIGEGFRSELNDQTYMETEMFSVNGIFQIQGITQTPYYVTEIRENGTVYCSKILYTAWVAPEGHTPFAGAYSPYNQLLARDLMYDLAPAYHACGIKSTKQIVPDTDWYQRACVQTVTSSTYGRRSFIIMESADGLFTCWPVDLQPSEDDLRNPTYIPQNIKTNIPPEYAQQVTPAYPDWVYRGDSKRDTYIERGNNETLDPRYIWSFDSAGTHAIAAMVERTTVELNYGKLTVTSSSPEELTTEIPISVLADGGNFPVKIDRLGMVELALVIELTGSNLEDFSFSITVASHTPPQDDDDSRLVGVAYAMPTRWDRFSDEIGNITPDDVIEARLFLYQHEDAAKYVAAMDGNYGGEFHHQAITVIRNLTKDTELLRLPMHLMTYTNTPYTTNIPTLASVILNPAYSAKIGFMDLSSLSFHYTITATQPYVDPTIVEGLIPKPGGYYFNRNVLYKRSKLRNSVYVFGQVMNIQEIGHESISLDEFLEATHPVSGVSIYPVNTISTIRGNGTNMFGAYSPSFYNKLIIKPFWWIRTVDLNATFEDQFERIWECTVWGWTFGQMGGINLWDVTEESFYEDFMKWVYNGIKVYPDDYPYNMVLREEVGSKLRALNANFDSDMWENDIQWLLWNIFKFARDSIGSVEGTFPSDALSDIRNVWYTAVSYFTPCSTELYSKFYKEPLDTTDEDVIVRNFPYGELDYSNSIKKFFFPVDIWHGKVLVHPDGHCSAFYKDSLICGKDYVQNYTIFNYEPRFLIDVPGGNILVPYTMSLDLQTYADPGTDAFALFDTMVVDYISFWDGEIETTHNALYNTAYNHDFSLDSYWPQLEIAKKSHGECGITQDGRYTPMHYINSYFFIVPSVNGISFDSTPGCISATRLSAAFT